MRLRHYRIPSILGLNLTLKRNAEFKRDKLQLSFENVMRFKVMVRAKYETSCTNLTRPYL